MGLLFGTNCTRLPGPEDARRDYARLTYDECHQLCRKRGLAGKGSKAALQTRLSTTDAADRKRVREKEDAVNKSEDMPADLDKHCRVDDLHLAFAVDEEIKGEHAHWWIPGMKAHWNPAIAFPLKGVDAVMSALAADQSDETLG